MLYIKIGIKIRRLRITNGTTFLFGEGDGDDRLNIFMTRGQFYPPRLP